MSPEELQKELEGRYVLERVLGHGGMSVVYRAFHEELGRAVALKILFGHLAHDPDWRARFKEEARLAARITHPNLVRLLDFGDLKSMAYIAFELLEGPTLRSELQRHGGFSLGRALELGRGIALGLAALHEEGILHRDLKPDNVILERRGPVITDLGIAKEISGSRVHTQTGLLLGTPQYMSPEYILGEKRLTTATDVYSLGILFHELLIGRCPFEADNLTDILKAHLEAPAPALPLEIQNQSPVLARTIAACLGKDPAGRPDTREVADALLPDLPEPGEEEGLRPASFQTLSVSRIPAGQPLEEGRGITLLVTGASSHRPTLQFRRRLVGAVLFSLSAGFLLSWTLLHSPPTSSRRPRVDPDPGASRHVSRPDIHGSGSPAPVDLSRVKPGLLARAVGFRPLLGGLRGSREKARATVLLLRKKAAPVDLGMDPGFWAFWIELADWLYVRGPGTSLRLPDDTGQIPLRLLIEQGEKDEISPGLVQRTLRLVSVAPQEPEAWLYLGRTLELDGAPDLAPAAYKRALTALKDKILVDRPNFIWVALLRALLLVPGHVIEREPWDHVPAGEAWKVLGALEAVCLPRDPDHFEAVLREGAKRERLGPGVVERLAAFLIRDRRNLRAAIACLKEGVERNPDVGSLADFLGQTYLGLGFLDQLRPLIPRTRQPDWWQSLHDFFAGTADEIMDPARLNDRARLSLRVGFKPRERRVHHILRLLERGRIGDACSGLSSLAILPASGPAELEMLFASQAAGCAPPWMKSGLDVPLSSKTLNWPLWVRSTRSWTYGPGLERMAAAFEQARSLFPGSPHLDLLRSLWLARTGGTLPALDLFRRTLEQMQPYPMPPLETIEVLARGVYRTVANGPAGESTEVTRPVTLTAGHDEARMAAALEEARRFGAAQDSQIPLPLWKHLRAGDLPLVRSVCEEMIYQNQSELLPRFILIWDDMARGAVEEAGIRIASTRAFTRLHSLSLGAIRELDALERALAAPKNN